MPVWPALLLSPILALGAQAIMYALATPSCQAQHEPWLHLIPPAFATITVLMTAMAWVELRRLRPASAQSLHVDADASDLRSYFLACVALWCGALSTLAIVAMWIPQWVLSACAA